MTILETRGPYRFGAWTVTQIVESEVEAFASDYLFPGIPLDEVRQAAPQGKSSHLTATGMVIMANQLFVLQKGQMVMLAELGTGNGKTRPAEPYWDHQNLPYLETLASLGIQPEQVAYVGLSHFHNDHVGLATTFRDGQWQPTFPQAQYLAHTDEWKFWGDLPATDPRWHPCIDDSVRPLVKAGVVRWVQDGDLIDGIHIHAAPGHTPGNILFEVEGESLWLVGDLFHHPAQIARPEWPSASFDVDRQANYAQRRRFFKHFAATQATIFPMHLGEPWQVKPVGQDQYFASPAILEQAEG